MFTRISFYIILSSEINAYPKQIIGDINHYWNDMISISAYIFTVAFLITSDFSIHLMHFTSELQMPITFLFVNESIKCVYAFS